MLRVVPASEEDTTFCLPVRLSAKTWEKIYWMNLRTQEFRIYRDFSTATDRYQQISIKEMSWEYSTRPGCVLTREKATYKHW